MPLLSWCVLSFSTVWTTATLYLLTSTLIKYTGLKKNQYYASKVVFYKHRHKHVKPLLKRLHWLPVKERILFKTANFAFGFFDGTLPPHLSSCLFVFTPSCTLHAGHDEKKLPMQDGDLRAAVISHSLFWLPLHETTYLLMSETAVSSLIQFLKPCFVLLP